MKAALSLVASTLGGAIAVIGVGGAPALDTGALFEALQNSSLVRCDAPAFTLFGLSLAGYNVIACLVLAGLALYKTETETSGS